MKTLKRVTLGLLAALFAGTAVEAQTTYFHLAGSTAFRAPATAAIIDYLHASNGGGKTVHAGYDNGSTSLLGCNQAILANGTIGASGTATIIVEIYWTGSAAGLVDLVAQNNKDQFFDPSNLDTTDMNAFNTSGNAATIDQFPAGTDSTNNPSSYTGYGGGVEFVAGSTPTVTNNADMAMCDSYNTTVSTELATVNKAGPSDYTQIGSFSTLTSLVNAVNGGGSPSVQECGTDGELQVGVLPFQWVAGHGSPTNVTNISQSTAKSLLAAGYVSQAQLTGAAGDSTNYFYLTGRNEDSGTRIDTYSEAQFGVIKPPYQYDLTPAQPAAVTGAGGWAASTTLFTQANITWNTQGHSGYNKGSDVAKALGQLEGGGNYINDSTNPASNTGASYFMGYLGVTDAKTAIGLSCHALTYNGVGYSIAAVENGQYTIWGYEYSYRLSNSAVGAIADAIADNIYNTDADIDGNGYHSNASGMQGATPPDVAAGILYNNMNCTRPQSEGGPIGYNQ